MIEVRPIDDQEMFRFYRRSILPVAKGYAGRDGLRTVIVGGLAYDTDGRIWGFLDTKPGYRRNIIYRYLLKFLADAREDGVPEISVSRDTSLGTSERLLTRAGFRKTDEQIEGHEIWMWRNEEVVKDHG